MNLEDAIAQGLRRLDLQAPSHAPAQWADFVRLLARWNRVYNLTAVREPRDMVVRHILDSLAVAPWLAGVRVLDVGSGAGLPGIPLAILYPHRRFTLIDSSAKRTRFMTQAVAELRLTQVTVCRARVQDYAGEGGFDTVLSRAFSDLAGFVRLAGRLCRPEGRLLAMKGAVSRTELADLSMGEGVGGYRVMGVVPLTVPGLDAQRHLVHLAPPSAQEAASRQAGDQQAGNSSWAR